MFEGKLREAMTAIKEALETDATMIENKCNIVYRLAHPSKQIGCNAGTFTVVLEPSGFSQLSGAGALDLQYFFWIFIKCKPSIFGTNDEERLSKIMEYLSETIHGKKWGSMNTFLSRGMINYRTITLKTNSRDIDFELAKDEIGACLMFWGSLKSQQELQNTDVEVE